jgi:hypothetical protein
MNKLKTDTQLPQTIVMPSAYILSEQISLYGEPDCIGFGNAEFYVKEIPKKISNKMIIENHYSKKVAGFATTYIYLGVFENDKLLGTLQYGFMMNPASAKNIVEGTGIYEHLELNRMWLSDEIKGKYPESRAISFSIKYIKRKFPKIKWIQSFADERCGGFGIVYQACSFDFYGEHTSEFYSLDGEYVHKIALTHHADTRPLYQKIRARKDELQKESLRQFRYIKFLNQKWKKKCLLEQKPYIKHYAEH